MSQVPRWRQARPSRPARQPVQGCTRTAPLASGHYNDHRRSSFVHASSRVSALRNIATRLRIDSVRATTEAGSGHPTSSCSAADLTAAIFFSEMRYDPRNPHNPDNDRFVLSKGHAAPVLYAAWAEAGIISRAELLKLRRFDSDLEGHPTPRLPWVDVATGSLGQGICAAVGIALNARRINSDYRTYVLLGDGEIAEGSVWEAAHAADHEKLDSLCGIVDVNGLGQKGPSLWNHDIKAYVDRRSEEHTSELQSQSNLVCRLLLEKKKKKK